MARTGYRHGQIADTAHCPGALAVTQHSTLNEGTGNPAIAWNGSHYCCALLHVNATGVLAAPKVYTSKDGLSWTWTSSLSTLDADDVWTVEDCSVPAVHVDSNSDFVIPTIHNGTTPGAGAELYDIGTKVVDGVTLAVTDNASIYSNIGCSGSSSSRMANSCIDSSGNVWLAHGAGVTRLTGNDATGQNWTWADIYTNAGIGLDPLVDYRHDYSNVDIAPINAGGVLATVHSWRWPGANYPCHTFLWNGAAWSNAKQWTTSSVATQHSSVGDVTNGVAYFTYAQEGTTDITLSKYDGSFSNLTTTLAADLGYHATTNNPRLPKLTLAPDSTGDLIIGLHIEQSGSITNNRAFHIWRTPNDGTNWYFVGAANWHQSTQYTPTIDSFKHGHLAEYYNADDNIYMLGANRYSWFFRDFGDKKQFVHQSDDSYNDSNRRGTGPGRHTCIAANKVWFVHETGGNIVLLHSIDGENWDSLTVKTGGANPAMCLNNGTIYIIYQDTGSGNRVKGKAITASTATAGSEISVSTVNEVDANIRISIDISEAGKFWVAVGGNHGIFDATNVGRVWSNTAWDSTWTVHNFMASSRRLGRCPEIVVHPSEDVSVIDARAGWPNLYMHFYDDGTSTWSESEDNTAGWNIAGEPGYAAVCAVVDSSNVVHVVSNNAGTILYHTRSAAGVWTTSTNITNNFCAYITDLNNPIITIDRATDNLRIYAINNQSNILTRAVTWSTSTDGGGTWTASNELHDLGILTTAGTVMNYSGLYTPYLETEPYVISIAAYETNDATKSGAIIQWFPRHQNYLRGSGYWYDNRKASPVGQYPYNI
jgi:hypothetical protein